MGTASRAIRRFQLWRLSRRWLGNPRWYQYVDLGDGVTTEPWLAGDTRLRTESFLAFLESGDWLEERDRVVDVGCNAGLFSLVAAQRAARVVGVEIEPGYIRQARYLRSRWASAGHRTDNVTFVAGSVAEHLELFADATVIFASKVLYHVLLGDAVERLMAAIAAGPAHRILLQGHTVRGELGQDDGMRELMRRHGFGYRLVEDVPEFPIAVAERAL